MKTTRLLGMGLAQTGLVLGGADTLVSPSATRVSCRNYTAPVPPSGTLVRFDYPSTWFSNEAPDEARLVWRERRSADYRLFRLVSRAAGPPEPAEYVSLRTLPWMDRYPNGRSSGRHLRQCGFDPYHGWDTRINDPRSGRCYVLSHLWQESESRGLGHTCLGSRKASGS